MLLILMILRASSENRVRRSTSMFLPLRTKRRHNFTPLIFGCLYRESYGRSSLRTMSQISSDQILSKETDFKLVGTSHPTYKLSRCNPMGNASSVTISAATLQESMIEVPAKVFNLSKSMLSFTLTPGAAGAGNFNWIATDTIATCSQ